MQLKSIINHTVNIAYSCDENYIQHTGISIISLLENNKDIEKITIYFIEKDVKESSIKLLNDIVNSYNRDFIVIPFNKLCSALDISSIGRHIETVYAKLFFGNITDVEKILYLDSDTIVNGSIKHIWQINLKHNYFGCVKTTTRNRMQVLGMKMNDDFYNDGVALVNTKKLREDNMEKKFLDFIGLFNGNPPVLSEGTINKVCQFKILSLHPKYNYSPIFFMFSNYQLSILTEGSNYYTNKELDEARSEPIIIHYLTGWYNRPWYKNCTHPLAEIYLYYKSISPWKDVPLSYKELNNKAKRMKIIYKLIPLRLILLIKSVRQLANS